MDGASAKSPGVTVSLTALAMLSFAGNSLLCRMALRGASIDAGSFTSIRMIAGAVMLALLVMPRRGWRGTLQTSDWRPAVALAAYAVPFSLAYLHLPASTGTLLAFGAVQVTMIGTALVRGERPERRVWLGLTAAAAGLLLLTLPGVTAPDPGCAIAMVIAGVAWGVYSLLGRGAADPAAATTANFVRAAPLCLVAGLASLPLIPPHATLQGMLLAVVSGAIPSGLGYVIWYAALRRLTAVRAALAQSTTPILAAFGGVMLFDEVVTVRLVLAATFVLAGAALAMPTRR